MQNLQGHAGFDQRVYSDADRTSCRHRQVPRLQTTLLVSDLVVLSASAVKPLPLGMGI